MIMIVGSSVLVFFALAFATKIVVGEERLIYYHHELAVLGAALLLLWLLDQPVLPYLDATILGIGAFLGCGRIGCLLVGCCHGRPARWGVRYREEHVEAGFPQHYVGVRLFPIQAVESLWAFLIVLIGISMIMSSRPPGTSLAWFVVAYNLGRFCLEFQRGDADRPYYLGFSEAQWIAWSLTVLVMGAALAGLLPLYSWQSAATAGIPLAMGIVSLHRSFLSPQTSKLVSAQHVQAVAKIIASRSSIVGKEAIVVRTTFLGVHISISEITANGSSYYHYALSCQNTMLTEAEARALSRLILQLHDCSRANCPVKGRHGVYHLMAYPA
jgi:hypothetical protein